MSADCSVGANPLAQLNKHTQNNSSLQPGSFQYSQGNAPQQFKSVTNRVTDAKLFQMDQFMSKSGVPMNNQVGLTPLRFQSGQALHPQNSDWSQNFHAQHETPSVQAMNSNQRNGWSNEFRSSSTSQNPGGQVTHQQAGMRGQMTSYMPSMSHAMRPMMRTGMSNMYSQSSMNQQQQNISSAGMAERNWDEQFKALEREVAEQLTLGETKDEIKEQNKEEIRLVDDYQTDFQEVWDNLQSQTNFEAETSDTQWEKDYARYMTGKSTHVSPYSFDKDNQYMHNPNAYEIGCILMENGAKLSEAALAFEAAVQEDPGHVDAWLKLGLVQTQNEKELNGISALEQCLKLDAKNLDALMTISISYINEGYDLTAFSMLNRWLDSKYPKLIKAASIDERNIDRYNLSKEVIAKFLHVANSLPQVDPDVQLGLGTLFYANEEFDKTIDCFRTALEVNPNDELMWNRLGASLANSNRSEEAIQAYHKALKLKPSFVRARYNLAISSMNIGCYKEAAESLLTALSMHEVENVPMTGSVVQSNNILETLKRSFIAMERRDLLEKVHPGMELQQFRNEFNF